MKVNQSQPIMKRQIKAIAAIMLFTAPAAHAEPKTFVQKDEIVVTATRTPEDPYSLPCDIEIISQDAIEKESLSSVGDLIETASGVTLTGAGIWETQPTIRGFSGNRVLVLIDGDRETNLWAGREPFTPFMDTGRIERVEILKGPASVLYGSDAMGGVINIITKKPEFTQGGPWAFSPSATIGYSSNDSGKYGNLVLDGANSDVAVRLEASTRDHDSYRDGNGDTVDNSQFEGMSVGAAASWKVNEKNELSASWRRSDIDDMGQPQKENYPWSHFTKFDTDTWKIGWHAKDIGIITDLELKGWLVDQKRVYDGQTYNTDTSKIRNKDNWIDTGAKGASLQLTFNPTAKDVLVSGIEFVREDARSGEILTNTDGEVTNTYPPVSEDAYRNHVGVYAQNTRSFSNGSRVIGGVRYDWFNADAEDAVITAGTKTYSTPFSEESDGAVTANLGYVLPLSSVLNANINAATGFRAPDIFERFSFRGTSSYYIGNPALKPEYSWNIDARLKMRDDKFSGSLTGFYSRIQDFIDQEKVDNTFNLPSDKTYYQYINVMDAELFGFDANASWKALDHLTLFGGISSVIGKNRDNDDRLNSIAPTNGRLGARWDDSLGRNSSWWLEVNTELYADQDNPGPGNELATPGYGLVNLKSGIRFARNVTLAVAVDNLFDRTYRSHLGSADFLYEPGINVKTSINVTL